MSARRPTAAGAGAVKSVEGEAGGGWMLTYRGVVYPWQCDHMGHMNVMWYVGKFDEATWALFASIGITSAYIREEKCGMAAVQQNIAYRRELAGGEVVEVRSRILEVRDKVIRFEHELMADRGGEVAARCELTAVHLDLAKRKSCPFPASIAAIARAKLAG